MEKIWILVLICCTFLSACAGQEVVPTLSAEPSPIDAFALPSERGDYFATSGVCSTCHKDMRDGEGQDVSIDTYWRGTMMANSSRDPYWQASVRAEVISNPDYDEIIQDKCTTCHTPMARTTRTFTGDSGVLLDKGFLDTENDLHVLALDGISCTLCHQIKDKHLGDEKSFDGGYVIDSTKPVGERVNFGPYDVADESVVLMRSASGYIPEQSKHIQTAEFCGACHTLYTPTVDNNGDVAGLFAEQMPYIEWLASAYADEKSCQDCHMPEAPGEVVLSITQSLGRPNFSKHSFAGGNTYGLQLLQVYGEDLGVTASNDQINAALERAKNQLKDQTAQVLIKNATILESILDIEVIIDSQVGHKFPSGFPSRRVWLHLVVQDANGVVIFESGKWDDAGEIYNNQNDQDDSEFEPHYQVIDRPEQVQIYEAIMGDVDSSVTTTLLRGAVYLKDNRLLPSGFNKDQVSDDIGVFGNALADPDFQGGGDVLHYQVPIDPTTGPFSVSVELLYQSIGYRWAQNLSRFDATEPERFLNYYANVANLPILISSDLMDVGLNLD